MSVFDRLVAICGGRHVRSAGPVDAIATVPARWVAAPGSADEVAGVVSVAADEGLALVARGSGSKVDWGPPPARLDVVVDLVRLSGVHRGADPRGTGDPVATVGAGTSLRAAGAILGRTGERVPLDPGSASATIGGALSTDEGGPLRLRHGPPSDLVAGVEFVGADGVIAHSVGTRRRRSEGYDLGALLCGSRGTLGLITSATLRLDPVPPSRTWVLHPVRTPREVRDLTVAVLGGGLEPAAIEMDLPPAGPGTLGVLFEGAPAAVSVRCGAALTLLGGPATLVDEPPPWWGRYPFRPGDIALKLAAPVAWLHAAVYALRDGAGVPIPVRGSPGVGEAYATLPRDLPLVRTQAALAAVRTALADRGGSCTVLAAPMLVRVALDLWGEVPGVADARWAKQRFDPAGIFAPGRSMSGL